MISVVLPEYLESERKLQARSPRKARLGRPQLDGA